MTTEYSSISGVIPKEGLVQLESAKPSFGMTMVKIGFSVQGLLFVLL